MNKYVFPGADASCSLGWVVGKARYLFLPVSSFISHIVFSNSLRVPALKSKISTFSVSTTLLLFTVGIKTGLATRTMSLPSTATDGSESGHSSLRIVLSRAGKFIFYFFTGIMI